MVAKISVGSSLFGALSYNQNKVDEEQGKVLLSNRMFESEDGNFSIRRCMECFDMHLPADLKTEKPIIHISLNPHPDDVLSDSQLADIAKEYMDKLGYGNQPYMVYKHEDIARHHIHIVSIRVDDTGKKINDKFEHIRSKQITRELEQKYGLHPAEKKQAADRPELKKVDYRAGDVKHQLSNTVKALASSYRFQSFTEYKALLSIYNVQAEEVKGEVNGKPYNGIVYSATNDKGEKQGNPFKSSSLGKSVGYEAIQRHIKKSAKDIQDKNLKERTRRTVGAVMKSAHNRKYSINSLVYWVTYVHNVVYSFYRSMIYCYINSTQRCAGSIEIDIIPTNGADKRKFSPFAPYFPVTNVIKRYFYPYFPAIIGIKGYSFPYFPYLSGIMKIKTALYSLFSRLDWHKTVVFPCLGEIYEGIRSLSWEIPVT